MSVEDCTYTHFRVVDVVEFLVLVAFPLIQKR